MGKAWDKTGIAYDVAMWREVLRVLKPGGHLLAFGGARTYHRLACAIEDAGFEVRDQIMWVYGSGFPKSLDVSKAIDERQAGNDIIRPWLKSLGSREQIANAAGVTPRQVDHWLGENTPCPQTLTAPRFARLCEHFQQTPEWAEAMFPKVGTLLGLQRHARSGGDDFAKCPGAEASPRTTEVRAAATDAAKQWSGWGTALKPAHEPICLARKPLVGTVAQNVLQHGTGAINVNGCRVELNGDYKCKANGRPSQTGLGDNYDPAKANQPDTVGRWPANLIHDGSDEVVVLFPRTKSGTLTPDMNVKASTGWSGGSRADRVKSTFTANEGSAARFFYCAKASRKERGDANKHPTVKPIALMRYLCRLVTPPDGVVFDPFMGSGSTGVAAINEGFRFIGIEMEQESFDTAQRRMSAAKLEPRESKSEE
jgi:hypothetical protein